MYTEQNDNKLFRVHKVGVVKIIMVYEVIFILVHSEAGIKKPHCFRENKFRIITALTACSHNALNDYVPLAQRSVCLPLKERLSVYRSYLKSLVVTDYVPPCHHFCAQQQPLLSLCLTVHLLFAVATLPPPPLK